MLTRNQKITYLSSSLSKLFRGKWYICPSCGSSNSEIVDRKYVVTTLRRCEGCSLLYRAPTTTMAEFDKFYQQEYSEGFTTALPLDEELAQLKSNNFYNSGKDYSLYVEILNSLGCNSGDAVLDYGCSWGYGSWQFANAGFDVAGFEVSRERCNFAREKLGVDAHSDATAFNKYPKFKVVFSSHVLEHIPDISSAIQTARSLIAPGGYLLAFTPNGSEAYRAIAGAQWSGIWGFVHPLFVDSEFYKSEFDQDEYLIDSSSYELDRIKAWASDSSISREVVKTCGPELMVVVKCGL